MIFNSAIFILFFLCLHFLYWLSPNRTRNHILLIGSIIFYGYWNIPFLFHFLTIIGINYLLYRISIKHPGKLSLGITISFNLINLAFFKYFYFITKIVADTFQISNLNTKISGFLPEIILPLAISFYTFQLIALQVDSYREGFRDKISAEKFFLFILYFPQLIAGPIMRHNEFFSQLEAKRRYSELSFNSGYILILIGVLKKIVIADTISGVIDPVYLNPGEYNAQSILLAVYGFALQIYCDFAGYTDMARGMSLLLGFDIPANFKAPYFSQNFNEFWRRWHITLSTWLRDYLYIPLGGNRHGKIRTYFNLFITMVLGGLWHGANYTFLIWGFLHGTYLVIERAISNPKSESKQISFFRKTLQGLIVFHLVCFAWIFFRAPNLEIAIQIIQKMFDSYGSNLPNAEKLTSLFLLGIILHLYESRTDSSWRLQFKYRTAILPIFAIIITVIAITMSSKTAPFIYFQF
ncbi:MBOAT family O-acyltransferase [Leptospira santarosai]|uniref:Membrane-bound O-acyltransferase family protein n=1 Tax=Leptospira santarosai TaxID=28183 RepID=A0AB73MBF1_9LEPT|nr:MBOAT family O-acyltransferase [Leptospira santarosai]AVV50587.1 Putative alginate O-acetyltransferase AlgI [Leptospira santarosai]ONF93806.1 membrane-bound O-acyltransferase family protein [Leptospira santarosai]